MVNCTLHVITSYSIHYTKLYDSGTNCPPNGPNLSGRVVPISCLSIALPGLSDIRGVFGAADFDGAGKGQAPFDDEFIHSFHLGWILTLTVFFENT